MSQFGRIVAGLTLFASGYTLGLFRAAEPQRVIADQQETGAEKVTDDTLLAYQRFIKGSNELSDSLASESLNTLAVEGRNFFALSVGGVDALRDLEEGRGVDPETFAAIYADRATPDVTQHIDTDAEGRKRYKKTVIRMYSKERLRDVFRRRDQMDIRSRRIGG